MKIVLLILATWRLTALLVYDKWFEWLRDTVKVYAVDELGEPVLFWGQVLNCFWCTSLITGTVLLAMAHLNIWLPIWLFALSGGAVLLNHITRIFRDAK